MGNWAPIDEYLDRVVGGRSWTEDAAASSRLNEHEVHLLGSLGNFLGGSIEYAQLMRTVRQHREELRQLTDKLFPDKAQGLSSTFH